MRNAVALAAVLLATSLQLACAGRPAPAEGQVSVHAVLTAMPVVVTRVTVELPAAGVASVLHAEPPDAWAGTLVVPVGAWTVTVRAFAEDLLVAEGSADVTVAADRVAQAAVELLDLTGTPPAPDHGPIIRSLTATATTILPAERVLLAVDAFDPDGDPLTYQWSRDCPSGTFSTPFAAETEFWSAAQAGCQVTVTVTAGAFTARRSVTMLVIGQAAAGQVQVTATIAPQPYVDRVYLDGVYTAQPVPVYEFSRTLTDACDGCEVTANATIPRVFFPTQQQPVRGYFANLPLRPWEHDDLRVWVDDDCGGSAEFPVGAVNEYDNVFYWTAPPTPGLCFVGVHVDHAGMTDSVTLAALVEGCADDRWENDDIPATATDIGDVRWIGAYQPQPGAPPALEHSKKLPGRFANDADWYVFGVHQQWPVLVVSAVSAEPVPLVLHASDGTVVAASSTGTLEVTAPGSGSYYLEVGPGDAAAPCGAGYDLVMDAYPVTP